MVLIWIFAIYLIPWYGQWYIILFLIELIFIYEINKHNKRLDHKHTLHDRSKWWSLMMVISFALKSVKSAKHRDGVLKPSNKNRKKKKKRVIEIEMSMQENILLGGVACLGPFFFYWCTSFHLMIWHQVQFYTLWTITRHWIKFEKNLCLKSKLLS